MKAYSLKKLLQRITSKGIFRLSFEKSVVSGLCYLFTAVSAFFLVKNGDIAESLPSVGSALLLVIPVIVESVFHWEMPFGLYVYVCIHCLGPLLGQSYRLFYITSWYDKLLHASSGAIFMLTGYKLIGVIGKTDDIEYRLKFAFGICFSITIAVLWEFSEYGVDLLFGCDNQHSAFISAVHTHLFGNGSGNLSHFEGIEQVVVDGVELPGYIDIGLIDTMDDMLFETIGAIIPVAILTLDRKTGLFSHTQSNDKKEKS